MPTVDFVWKRMKHPFIYSQTALCYSWALHLGALEIEDRGLEYMFDKLVELVFLKLVCKR